MSINNAKLKALMDELDKKPISKEELKRQKKQNNQYKKISKSGIVGILVVAGIILTIISVCVCNSRYNENLEKYTNDRVIEEYQKTGKAKFLFAASQNMIEYASLGQDIYYQYEYNGEPIKDDSVLISNGDSIKIVVTVVESDPSIDDSNSDTISFDTDDALAGKSKTIKLRVDENGGRRYADGYAVFEICVLLKPYFDESEINYWEVVYYNS